MLTLIALVKRVDRGRVTATLLLNVGLCIPFLLLRVGEGAPGSRALVLALRAGDRPVYVWMEIDFGVAMCVIARVPIMAVLYSSGWDRLVPSAGYGQVGQLAVFLKGGPSVLAHRVRVPALLTLAFVARLLLLGHSLMAGDGLCVGHHAGATLHKERHNCVVRIKRLQTLKLGLIKQNELFNKTVSEIVNH